LVRYSEKGGEELGQEKGGDGVGATRKSQKSSQEICYIIQNKKEIKGSTQEPIRGGRKGRTPRGD